MAVIRPYQPGDERGILDLFQAVFQDEMPMPVWQWKYLRGGDPPPVCVAEEDEKIVCHFAAMPHRMVWQGRTEVAWSLVDSMCHPNYQGKGLFRRALQAFKQEVSDRQYLFAYGFPAKRFKRLGELIFGFEPVARTYRVHKDLAASAPSPSTEGLVFDVLPQDWDRHWHQLQTRFALAACRDRAYLAWRYFARPDRRYRLVTVPESPALAMVGVEHKEAFLMEFLVEHNEETLPKMLLRGVEAIAQEEGAEVIKGWFPEFSWERDFFCNYGNYSGKEDKKWLVCGELDQRLSARWLAEHFYYSYGDSDEN